MTARGTTRREYLSVLAGAAMVGVAGCSGDDGSDDGTETSGDDGGAEEGNDTDRDVVTGVRPATRNEGGTQVASLEVSLVANHGIDEMSLVRDGTEIQTRSVESGARTVSFETGRDVEDADILEAGNYTLLSRSGGEVVAEYPTPLQKAVEIRNLELGRKEQGENALGVKTFRFDIVNVGDLPIDFEEGYVTGDVPRPGEQDGIAQQLVVEHRLADQWDGPSDGLETVESFPGGGTASSTPVLIRKTPLKAPIDGELRTNYCDGSQREATIHLRGKGGYRKEIDVRFTVSEVFGDFCLEGQVRSARTR